MWLQAILSIAPFIIILFSYLLKISHFIRKDPATNPDNKDTWLEMAHVKWCCNEGKDWRINPAFWCDIHIVLCLVNSLRARLNWDTSDGSLKERIVVLHTGQVHWKGLPQLVLAHTKCWLTWLAITHSSHSCSSRMLISMIFLTASLTHRNNKCSLKNPKTEVFYICQFYHALN